MKTVTVPTRQEALNAAVDMATQEMALSAMVCKIHCIDLDNYLLNVPQTSTNVSKEYVETSADAST